jgi:ankyrin repeat protein
LKAVGKDEEDAESPPFFTARLGSEPRMKYEEPTEEKDEMEEDRESTQQLSGKVRSDLEEEDEERDPESEDEVSPAHTLMLGAETPLEKSSHSHYFSSEDEEENLGQGSPTVVGSQLKERQESDAEEEQSRQFTASQIERAREEEDQLHQPPWNSGGEDEDEEMPSFSLHTQYAENVGFYYNGNSGIADFVTLDEVKALTESINEKNTAAFVSILDKAERLYRKSLSSEFDDSEEIDEAINIAKKLFGRVQFEEVDRETIFHRAVKANAVEIMNYMIEWSIDGINEPNVDGNTPLHLAVLTERSEMVSLILSKANVEPLVFAHNLSNETPLSLTGSILNKEIAIKLMESNEVPQNIDSVKKIKFLKNKKTSEIQKEINNFYFRLYLEVGEDGKAAEFLSGNTHINPWWKPTWGDDRDSFALEIICTKGVVGCLKYFLEHLKNGRYPSILETPIVPDTDLIFLFTALVNGQVLCVDEIMRKVGQIDSKYLLAIMNHISETEDDFVIGGQEVISNFLSKVPKALKKTFWTELKNNPAVSKKLVIYKKLEEDFGTQKPARESTTKVVKEPKEPKNPQPIVDVTPLIAPAEVPVIQESPEIIKRIFKEVGTNNFVSILKSLKNPDYSPNLVNEDGLPLIHLAVTGDQNSLELLDSLIMHPKIDLNIKDKFGKTPFFLACENFPGSKLIYYFLKNSAVDVNVPNNDNLYPLMILVEKMEGHELESLALNYQKKFVFQDRNGMAFQTIFATERLNPSAVSKLKAFEVAQAKAFLGRIASEGNGNQFRIFVRDLPKAILDKIVNVKIFDAKDTLLTNACGKNHTEIVEALLEIPALEVNTKNSAEKSPLLIACESNNDCFKLLLKSKLSNTSLLSAFSEICKTGKINLLKLWIQSNLNVPTTLSNGKSFIDIANENNQMEVATLLSEYAVNPDKVRDQVSE